MAMTLGAADVAAAGSAPAWVMLIPAMPMLGVILCTLMAIMGVRSKLPAFATVACLAVSFVLTVAMFAGHEGHGPTVVHAWDWISIAWGNEPGQQFTSSFGFYVDKLTILWMLFVTGLATLIALYASEYMSHDVGAGYCRFFAAFNLFVFSMACLVMGANLVMLYLGWEGVGLCSYLLIGYFYKKPSAVAAAKKAFIVNRVGDLGLALGLYLTFVHFGTIEYANLFASDKLAHYLALAREGNFDQIPMTAQWIALLLMVGAFGKSAQLPLYVWLPDAMEGPTPVSALIHAATMVTAGVYLIARAYPLFVASEFALPIVAWVGALTALLAATIGMAQFDIKRIMAYSTVSQLGYMFAGLGVMSSVGAAFHVLTHAFFKALLFLACGAVMHGFAGQLDLRKLSGVSKMKGWGIVSIGMLIGCLNLSGFPLTAGFFSKDMILAESFVTPGFGLLGWILLLTAGLTAYYTFRVFFRVFLGPVEYEPGDEVHAHDDHGHDGHDGHGDHGSHTAAHVAHAGHAEAGDQDHHGQFHPHAPGWAINLVLATLAGLSIVAAGLYFIGDHGWVSGMIHDSTAHVDLGHEGDHAHGSAALLGLDPHKAMYFISAGIGLIGIAIAYLLHLRGRTSAGFAPGAETAKKAVGRVQVWAENKWYVDEFYDLIVRRPLLLFSQIFRYVDMLLVDGLVNVAGWLPSALGGRLRRGQTGVLQSYAGSMAGGLALFVVIVLLIVSRQG
ncbi:MAG: NADH-quinone oxidoreductase subunit L [Phycisphaeraceae bacterium]|nr:NADH-quinone oxidoreductase subunit L [Phycisphaeraceae bacterium]MCW5761935.1 NADH-quinone oxidoreductase subunit L [Phycisphaeraceae bacterium]